MSQNPLYPTSLEQSTTPEQISNLTPAERQELIRLLTAVPFQQPLREYTAPQRMSHLEVLETSRRCAKYMRTMVEHRTQDIERRLLPTHLLGEMEYYEERLSRLDPIMNGQDTGKPAEDFLYACPCCMKKNPDDGQPLNAHFKE